MKHLHVLSLIAFCGLLVGPCPESSGKAADNSVTETIHLFNGKDLSGFYTFVKERGRDADPKKVFTVQDGLLRISGEEWGCVTSDAEYENYHLIAEFKWGEITHAPRVDRARDSGILVHSVGEDGGYSGIWMRSIECQLIEGGTGDFIVVGDGSEAYAVTCPVAPEQEGSSHVYLPGGTPATRYSGRVNWYDRDPGWKDVKGYRGARDVEKPVGEWNRLECICDGESITVLLNGVTVNRCFKALPSRGRIQVQSEGAELFFRRIDLLPLEDASRTASVDARPRRLIYNCDANNTFIYDEPPMTPADVYKYVDEVAAVGVTTFFMCPNFGMVMNYPTEAGDFIGEHASPALLESVKPDAAAKSSERGIVNLRGLIAAGHDPMGLMFNRAREVGMETFLTFRLNEVHAVDQEDHLILSRFWKEHPEWRIGKPGDPLPQLYLDILGPRTHPIVAGWLPGGLDFSVPEVRAHRLAQLRECCERFPIDGLDLDFQRFPMYFKPGTETDNVAVMTQWIREIRSMMREVGEKRGRPLLLSVRIMARPEQNLAIGLDPLTWAQEELVDLVTVSHYLRNDFPLPVAEYRALLPPKMPMYGSIEVEPEPDSYRTMARDLWRGGVDGILVYNFFSTREGGKEPPFGLLRELRDPK